MPTKHDVILRAYRRVNIVSAEEPMTADQISVGEEVLDAIYAEVGEMATFPFTLDNVPQNAFGALAGLLSYDLAIENDVPPKESRGFAKLRLLAVINPDNREDVAEAAYY